MRHAYRNPGFADEVSSDTFIDIGGYSRRTANLAYVATLDLMSNEPQRFRGRRKHQRRLLIRAYNLLK